MACDRRLFIGSTCGRWTAGGLFAALVCAATTTFAQPAAAPAPANPVAPAAAPAPADPVAPAKPAAPAAAPAAADPAAPAKPVEPAGPRVKQKAWLFKIPLPISGQTVERLRLPVVQVVDDASKAGLQPVLIFEFAVSKGQEDFGRGSKIGHAYELANFLSSPELSTAQTVAYLPRTVQGHAVLAVLACRMIAMAPDAQMGPAGVDEPAVTAAVLSTYKEIAARGRKAPVEVAYKLVDASRELMSVETDTGLEYTTPGGLPELGKNRTLAAKKVVLRAGQPGQFSGVEAKQRGLADFLASNRNELAAALDLSGGDLKEELWLMGSPKAVLVDIKGRISTDTAGRIRRMIQEAVRNEGANCVILRIDSAGGLVAECLELARYLAFDLEPDKVQSIAYIPKEARADAALIALACDRIAMGPNAVLGGEGYGSLGEGDLDEILKFLREGMAVQKQRSWSIPAAMFDPSLTVSRYTKDAQTAYFCEAEWKAQVRPEPWRQGEVFKSPGKPLLLKGEDAQSMPLGVQTFTSFPQLLAEFGLDRDPTLLETRWVDKLAAVLSSRVMAVFLLIVGGVALYIEMHAPGISLPGFLALVCFALFFWGQFLGGTPVGLAVVLFLAGIVCVLVEVFVLPGLGVFGLGGGALILASFVLASQSFLVPRNSYEMAEFQRSLAVVVTAVLLTGGCITAINRWLPRAPFFGRIILSPPSREESKTIARKEAMDELHFLLGQLGRATTSLTPGGKARFHDTLYHVVTDGDFLPADAEVEVIEVAGNRIVVHATGS